MKVITIASRLALPRVRVLARSVATWHETGSFAAVITDLASDDDLSGESFHVVAPSALALPEDDFARMSFMYDHKELALALRPWALAWALRDGADVAIHLDADAAVYDSLQEVSDAAVAAGVVVAPRRHTPVPADGLRPDTDDFSTLGVQCPGLIAVSDRGRNWLDQWQRRVVDAPCGRQALEEFSDQQWIDTVPALFPGGQIVDPGLCVGYWNVDERPIDVSDGRWMADGMPLRTFHFTQFDPDRPWLLTTAGVHAPRVVLSEHPALEKLVDEYAELLAKATPTDPDAPEYRFDTFADGTPVTPGIRRLYRNDLRASTRHAPGRPTVPPPIPDLENGFANIADWLREASDRMAGMSRLAYGIWASRIDLQGAFPEPQGASRQAFADWLDTCGVAEGYVTAQWASAILPRSVDSRPVVDEVGLNVFGYFASVLGVGVTARHVVRAAERAGLPVSIHTSTVAPGPVTRDFDTERPDVRYPVNLVAMNADTFPLWVERWGTQFAPGAHTIGLWAWELAELPQRMRGSFGHVDEIWTPSEFNAGAFRRATDLPVHVFPIPAVAQHRQPWPDFAETTEERGYFVFVFDYLSEVERKNPAGLIRAFLKAFPDDEGPDLVLKSINGDQRRAERESVRRAAASSRRIRLLEQNLPAEEVQSLIQHAIAFVSLHRSEGFGLGLMEAMAAGTPVVATGYSGNLEFMSPDNSILIEATQIPVTESGGYYRGLGHWADPDEAGAAEALRRLAADRAFAAELGARGQADVLERFSLDRAAHFIAGRVTDITTPPPPQPPPPPLPPKSFRERATARIRRATPG